MDRLLHGPKLKFGIALQGAEKRGDERSEKGGKGG